MIPFEEPRYQGLYVHTYRKCPFTREPLIVSVVGPTQLCHRFWARATEMPAKVRKKTGSDGMTKNVDRRSLFDSMTYIPLAPSAGIRGTEPTFTFVEPNPKWVEGSTTQPKTRVATLTAKGPHEGALLVGFRKFEAPVRALPGQTRLTLVHPWLAVGQALVYSDSRPIAAIDHDVLLLRCAQQLSVPLSKAEIAQVGRENDLIVEAPGFGDPVWCAHGDTSRWLSALGSTVLDTAPADAEDDSDHAGDDENDDE